MLARLPTGRIGQATALLLLAALLWLAWLAIASPLLERYAERAEALAGRETLATRMAQVAATLPGLQRQAASTAAPVAITVFEGGTDAVAGAQLQQRVQELATGVGAVLSSAEVLPAAEAGTYRRLGLRIALNAPWPVLVRLLEALTQAEPGMIVDDLQIHGSRAFIRDKAQPLDASWIILAFRSGAAPTGSPPGSPPRSPPGLP